MGYMKAAWHLVFGLLLVFGTVGSDFSSLFCRSIDFDLWPIPIFILKKNGSVYLPFWRFWLYFREVKDGRSRCQGCFFCVARCETCGGCIDLEELGESGLACSDFLCMDCWLKLPKCCTCNRPYCERHSNLKENLSASGEFTCQECTAFATSLKSLGEGY